MATLQDVDSILLYSCLYFIKYYLKNISFLPDPVDGAAHYKNYTSGCTALHMGRIQGLARCVRWFERLQILSFLNRIFEDFRASSFIAYRKRIELWR